jgi:carbonic anhydrase
VKDVARFNAEKLKQLKHEEKFDALCEFNVKEQVTNVCNTTVVQKAWNTGAELSVHGWIYNIENGILKELTSSVSSTLEAKQNP